MALRKGYIKKKCRGCGVVKPIPKYRVTCCKRCATKYARVRHKHFKNKRAKK